MHDSYKKWLDDGQPKVYCDCGCNKEIVIKRHHKWRGIPKYISGHNTTKSEWKKGHISWNQGLHWSNEIKQKIRDNHADMSGENNPNFGKPLSKEIKQKMSENHRDCSKEKNPAWKGGITSLNKIIRHCNEYDEWRLQIFGRDNFTCQCCGIRGIYLEAHHIKPFNEIIRENNITKSEDALNCKLLWDLNNGVTYCLECHDKLKKKGGKLKNI